MRVAAYCRVSTDHADQINSFENQKDYFDRYIRQQPDWTLYEIYADEGVTGTSTRKRTAFKQMLCDARAGAFSLLLTKEVSRFSRNILDTIRCTRELKALGVSVLFVSDGICTAEPDAELRLGIMGAIAQEESRKTSARVKWGQTRQMERGVVFGRSLLGYTVNGGAMTVEPDGAALVRQIFHLYAVEGKSAAAIARQLHAEGVRTPCGSTDWSGGYVMKILKNEKYTGDLVQKKTYTPDYLTHAKKYNRGAEPQICLTAHHEPIVSRALWEAAQARRQGQRRAGQSVTHPLSGKVRCGECGAYFVARPKKRADGTVYRRWCCATAARHGAAACSIGWQLREELASEMIKMCLATLQLPCKKVITNMEEILSAALRGTDTPQKPAALRDAANRLLNFEADSGAFTREILSCLTLYKNRQAEVHLTALEYTWRFSLDRA